jgi:hypothetical protein
MERGSIDVSQVTCNAGWSCSLRPQNKVYILVQNLNRSPFLGSTMLLADLGATKVENTVELKFQTTPNPRLQVPS